MSAPVVKFRKVQDRSWNGNGFGADPAWWDAEIDGEVIAKWRPRGEIYGRPTFAIYRYADWRTAVQQEAERRRAEPGEPD